MIREAEGWGFPSGHTQGAVVVWGYLGTRVKRRWFWIVAVLLMVLIPMSRVYLGVHFPHDLLGGYVIGGGLVLLYLWLQPKIESWLGDQTWGWVMGIALVVPIIMALVFPDKDAVTAVATLWGMSIGFVCERRWVGFEPSRSWWLRGLSLLIGLVVLAGLWYGLSLAFESLSPPLVLRFVRYGLVGLWGGLGAPWAFVRLGLAASKSGG
jgi:undecaprenyl-diphosphatase